jgi:hypothetical protein
MLEMDDYRFPAAMPQPTDDEYGVEPTVAHWSQLRKAADDSTVECYAVGEEVERAPFRLDADGWEDIVRRSPDDSVYKAAEADWVLSPTRGLRLVREHHEQIAARQQREDERIGRLNDPRRFTLQRLLFVLTLASLAFALGTRMQAFAGWGVFAGMVGLVALVTGAASRWLIGESAPAKLAWWTLMAVYLSASLFAFLPR